MITIIFAPPRTGKTCFMTHCLNEIAFDRERTRRMQNEIRLKNAAGFNLNVPQHCVSANYNINLKKFGYRERHVRIINPYRLGFSNPDVKTHFNFPFEAIGITEAQKYLNSRMSKYYPDWQSRWYEQHGHNNLDIFLDVQRPNLIDINIRELSGFIEIMQLDKHIGRFGVPDQLTWTIREIENSALFERYIASGKKDKDCYTERKVVADYNVFALYDSQSCKPKFYQGHFDEDIDYNAGGDTEPSVEGYIKFLERFDDELPPGFYKSNTEKKPENKPKPKELKTVC